MNCPRCDEPIVLGPDGQEFYGPCPSCIDQLRDKYKEEEMKAPLKTPFKVDL